jgi:hypothetical protein
MAYSSVPTVATGDLWTAANHNTYIRDNFAAGVPAIFTTAGDLAYASGAAVAARLPIGSNGQVLKVSSGLPVWGSSLEITKLVAATQSIPHNSATLVQFSTEVIDTGNFSNLATSNTRITIPAGFDGIVEVYGRAIWAAQNGTKRIRILRSGTEMAKEYFEGGSTGGIFTSQIQVVFNVTAAMYIELEVYHVDTGAALNITESDLTLKWLR